MPEIAPKQRYANRRIWFSAACEAVLPWFVDCKITVSLADSIRNLNETQFSLLLSHHTSCGQLARIGSHWQGLAELGSG
jgi:hypothetical protein